MRGMTNAAARAAEPIRLFRTGTFTSVEGVKVSLGESDLASIAASYNAANDPAPLVIGHPKIHDPAYGWVDRLAVEGDELLAWPDPARTDPSFAEAVKAGRYAKVSAQFYPPDNPHNPTPGQFYLKHVGFLGAHAPGVKGLGTVSFAAGDAGDLVTFEQEKAMPPTDTDKDANKDREASFAERERTISEREAAIAAREKAAAERAAKERHAANVSFAEGLFKEAKIKPEGKALLVGVLDALDSDDVVSFGEGAGEMTPRAALLKILDTAQPLVSLGEIAADDGKPIEGKLASFAAPAGYEVDPARAAIFQKAKALQTENPKLGWMDAVRAAGG